MNNNDKWDIIKERYQINTDDSEEEEDESWTEGEENEDIIESDNESFSSNNNSSISNKTVCSSNSDNKKIDNIFEHNMKTFQYSRSFMHDFDITTLNKISNSYYELPEEAYNTINNKNKNINYKYFNCGIKQNICNNEIQYYKYILLKIEDRLYELDQDIYNISYIINKNNNYNIISKEYHIDNNLENKLKILKSEKIKVLNYLSKYSNAIYSLYLNNDFNDIINYDKYFISEEYINIFLLNIISNNELKNNKIKLNFNLKNVDNCNSVLCFTMRNKYIKKITLDILIMFLNKLDNSETNITLILNILAKELQLYNEEDFYINIIDNNDKIIVEDLLEIIKTLHENINYLNNYNYVNYNTEFQEILNDDNMEIIYNYKIKFIMLYNELYNRIKFIYKAIDKDNNKLTETLKIINYLNDTKNNHIVINELTLLNHTLSKYIINIPIILNNVT